MKNITPPQADKHEWLEDQIFQAPTDGHRSVKVPEDILDLPSITMDYLDVSYHARARHNTNTHRPLTEERQRITRSRHQEQKRQESRARGASAGERVDHLVGVAGRLRRVPGGDGRQDEELFVVRFRLSQNGGGPQAKPEVLKLLVNRFQLSQNGGGPQAQPEVLKRLQVLRRTFVHFGGPLEVLKLFYVLQRTSIAYEVPWRSSGGPPALGGPLEVL